MGGATTGTRRGNGAGWGGAAKGAGRGGSAQAFTADSETRQTIPAGQGDPDKMADRAAKREIDAQRAQALKDHLYKLATGAEREAEQIRAAEAWLNRVEGMPVARNVNVNVGDPKDLTDAELAAIVQQSGRGVRTAAPEEDQE